MRNKLSYYSVILLVGLAMASALIFVSNPFNGAPATASPGAQAPETRNPSSASTNSTSTGTSSSVAAPVPIANGFGDDSHSGGTVDGDHDHHSDFPGLGGSTGNGPNTTSTTTSTHITYSQDA